MKNRTDLILFLASLALFLAMAVLGWEQLVYGINMRDPGMHLVDGWRLVNGDALFPDSSISAIQLYGVFNAAIFYVAPDITLLEIRQLAFCLNLLSLVLIGAAIYTWTRKPWPIFLILSLYAYTSTASGLDLSYHGYPRLFITTHISFLLFGIAAQLRWMRGVFFLASGLALWGIGFSFLPLTPTILSPMLLWLALKYIKGASIKFTMMELLLVVTPTIVLWGLFVLVYRTDFIEAVWAALHYVSEGGSVAKEYAAVWPYLTVSALIVTGLVVSWRLPMKIFSGILLLTSVAVFFIINTNLFGIIRLNQYDPFSISVGMWVFATLVVLSALVAAFLARQLANGESTTNSVLVLLMLIPSIIFATLHGSFSTRGVLQFCTAEVPLVMALSLYFVYRVTLRTSEVIAAMLLVVAIAPLYVHMAWQPSSATRSDVPVEYMTQTISGGFARGIRTNKVYADLIRWMEQTSSDYSRERDFALIFDSTPMGYMLVKRRPALNHSWTGWGGSAALRKDAMVDALDRNRSPRIAYRFVRQPIILYPPIKEGRATVAPGAHFPLDDPISSYVTTQMRLADVFSVKGSPWVEFYVRP